jgi:hypothetical protein
MMGTRTKLCFILPICNIILNLTSNKRKNYIILY